MRIATLLAVALVPVTLAACGPGYRAETGTAIGAVAGGVIGHQVGRGSGRIATAAIGAVAGGIIGHQIGRSLDEADRRAAMEAEYHALEYGEPGTRRQWRGREGRYGYIVPEEPYREGDRHCRRYAHTIYIDGRPETMRGVACRRDDGSWYNVA